MQNNYSELENRIEYSFSNKNLLELAFTHTSYINEHKMKKFQANQRIEFLGDAVLELVVSDFLYHKFKILDEGSLTKLRAKLVCEESLSNLSRELKLFKYLKVGKGEKSVENNNSIMCDTFECLLGAIYLDSDLTVASKFVSKFLLTDEHINKQNNDYKSVLQEYLHTKEQKADYIVVDEKGPDHNKIFVINLVVDGECIATSEGNSKKHAEQNAAKIAIEKYNLN